MRCELVQHRLPDLAQNTKRPLNMFVFRPLGAYDKPDAHFAIQIRTRQKQDVIFVLRFDWAAAALGETAVELHVKLVERLEVRGQCEGGCA